ncbi:hypothetical protein U0035_10950 [Niabella yanshanensis]|uniref:LGFP repeat-containing protein n=1 Tax=Niabella yanshanensis TaxID=577386 RepID=A0ABZ0WD93_9BACT|nr:hypothetical protein [Niabella yanshanensis]WQD40665.1 hypothetical protein U0035_10950 [Niabella yanshanensis]
MSKIFNAGPSIGNVMQQQHQASPLLYYYSKEFKEKMEGKYQEWGGESFFGLPEKKAGACWYYSRGCLYYTPQGIFEIHGEIYKKWRELGGARWGKPTTNELTCPDGKGKYNHFNHETASIYWSSHTGVFSCVGDIRQKWLSIGAEKSYLGYPTSDENDFPDGGRVSAFQGGGIYWWPDTGAIDLKDVALHYKGLVCIKETGEASGADEPYAAIGITTPFETKSFTTREYSSVDSNTSRPDYLELYRGKPNGIGLSIILMERDHGNPEEARKRVQTVVQKMHETGTLALGFIPVIGVGIAAIAGPLIQKLVPGTAQLISDFLGFADDQIGTQQITLTAKDLLLLATRTADSTYKSISFRLSTNNLRGENANYKLYFTVLPV